MAALALFHSVYGLRPAVLAAADRFRAQGHRVVAPDLYGTAPADRLAEGFALADKAGSDLVWDRCAEFLRLS